MLEARYLPSAWAKVASLSRVAIVTVTMDSIHLPSAKSLLDAAFESSIIKNSHICLTSRSVRDLKLSLSLRRCVLCDWVLSKDGALNITARTSPAPRVGLKYVLMDHFSGLTRFLRQWKIHPTRFRRFRDFIGVQWLIQELPNAIWCLQNNCDFNPLLTIMIVSRITKR